jgi:DNA polymerase (family 10)
VLDLTNEQVAAAFDELADLYELDGIVQYRYLAYRTAAKVIRETPISVVELARSGRATELQGIGQTLQDKIAALADTGVIPATERLREKVPPGLREIMHIAGFGAKRTRRIFDEMGIDSLDSLEAACKEHKLRSLRGFGEKMEDHLLSVLQQRHEDGAHPPGHAPRFVLSHGLMIGEEILNALRSQPEVTDVSLAGSLRRMDESVKDIDVVVGTEDPKAVIAGLGQHAMVQTVRGEGTAGARAFTYSGMVVDLKIVRSDQFGNALQHFTGSKAHNIQLRERAVRRGLHISEYGVLDDATESTFTSNSEADVYAHLGLDWIPPEMREGRGELDLARLEGKGANKKSKLPKLIELEDIRGELHCHTVASDGHQTIEQMALAALERGYEYLAITDHSATHGFGNDVSPDELKKQIERVREINEKVDGLELLIGTETNILPSGDPDYEDDLLAQLDWVIGSVHTSFRIGKKEMTARMVAAIEHPWIDAIGHPTGRKIERRPPYDVDIEEVIGAAARTGTMLEINAAPDRRDLNEFNARLAVDAGVMITINSDAHSRKNMDLLRYGVATARRAWLTAENVANTRSWPEFAKLRKRARARDS